MYNAECHGRGGGGCWRKYIDLRGKIKKGKGKKEENLKRDKRP